MQERKLGISEESGLRRRKTTSRVAERMQKEAKNVGDFMGVFASIGKGLQSQEIQLVYILLNVLDIFLLIYVMYEKTKSYDHLTSEIQGNNVTKRGLVKFVKNHNILLESSSITLIHDFILFSYFFELMVSVVAFGNKILTHSGYLVDICAMCLLLTFKAGYISSTPEQAFRIRIICFTRLWRLLRFLHAIIASIEEEVTKIQEKYDVRQQELEDMIENVGDLEFRLEREKKSLISMERVFDHQKEHVATLEEALRIAAESVASMEKQQEPKISEPSLSISQSSAVMINEDTKSMTLEEAESFFEVQ